MNHWAIVIEIPENRDCCSGNGYQVFFYLWEKKKRAIESSTRLTIWDVFIAEGLKCC